MCQIPISVLMGFTALTGILFTSIIVWALRTTWTPDPSDGGWSGPY